LLGMSLNWTDSANPAVLHRQSVYGASTTCCGVRERIKKMMEFLAIEDYPQFVAGLFNN